jgi:GTP-binding protein
MILDSRYYLARGGKGGHGNAFFGSSTNRSPQEFEMGKTGQTRNIYLELKLKADYALVGFPNAGNKKKYRFVLL